MPRETPMLHAVAVGSVDDGKSTLIGRLLYETGNLTADEIAHVEEASRKRGRKGIDLALLTDGLRAEREQGITIDVAYRYFATPRRKFILADCPGHFEYTRNMITGASSAQLALLLIDVRHGITPQTCRHAFLTTLLRIKHLVVCVNKMDLVDYQQSAFDRVREQFMAYAERLDAADIQFIPIAALHGDNIVEKSTQMPWYAGAPLLYTLENVYVRNDANHIDARFPVQTVIRPPSVPSTASGQSSTVHRLPSTGHPSTVHRLPSTGQSSTPSAASGQASSSGRLPSTVDRLPAALRYAGQVASGIFRPGEEVVHLPSGLTARITAIQGPSGPVAEAFHPMSVAIELDRDLAISRGEMLARPNNQPETSQDLEAMLCWLSDQPMDPARQYILRHTTRETGCLVSAVRYKLDITTLHRSQDQTPLNMNDLARVTLHTATPLHFDSYKKNRQTGSVILVDEVANTTVAAGMIL